MENAKLLLQLLGVRAYTKRHLEIVEDFLKSENKDAENLLSKISSSYDNRDISIVESFLNK